MKAHSKTIILKKQKEETQATAYTACLYNALYPNCPEKEGKCELSGIAVHQDGRCAVPDMIVAGNFAGQPIRPLRIIKVL
jgi:hypothetical protein